MTPEFVRKVISYERPDGIYVTFGGQTALNVGIALKDEFAGMGVKVRLAILLLWRVVRTPVMATMPVTVFFSGHADSGYMLMSVFVGPWDAYRYGYHD